jgi:hypothetical protein
MELDTILVRYNVSYSYMLTTHFDKSELNITLPSPLSYKWHLQDIFPQKIGIHIFLAFIIQSTFQAHLNLLS